ncbi:hypothetical protein [Leisingera sp.]|uniref:hypothetical protein n=1 Tax=Leisingera sp. TaxID=1879318 RepID=UPI002B269F03|nr:hypothetical protein [Leisingera sp.]
MFDPFQTAQTRGPDQAVFRGLRSTPIALPEADHRKLQEHLDDCAAAVQPQTTLLSYVLANKLMNARPMADVHCSDLAVGGSHVTYTVDGEAPQTGLLVHHAGPEPIRGVIPVASLLGATLIGMRVGQRAPLLCEDGSISKLIVSGVKLAI